MVPVGIKHRGHLRYDRSDCQNIEVPEFFARIRIKILVGNISAADQCHLIVDCKRLVVHTASETAHTECIHCSRFSMRKRIEEADLNILMRIQSCEAGVVTFGVHVVDQEAHPYAAIRRPQQRVDEHSAHEVIVDQEILCIDAALCPFCH